MPALLRQCSSNASAAAFSPLFDLELDGSRLLRNSGSRVSSINILDRNGSDRVNSLADLASAGGPQLQDHADVLDRLLALSCSHTGIEAQLSHHLQALRPTCSANGCIDIEETARQLLALGYLVQLRDGCDKANKDVRSCLRNLRHRFVVCIGMRGATGEAQYLPDPLVIDPRFREQFTVAHPTPEYDLLVKVRRPCVFLCCAAQAVAVVQLTANSLVCFYGFQAANVFLW